MPSSQQTDLQLPAPARGSDLRMSSCHQTRLHKTFPDCYFKTTTNKTQ